MSITLTETLSLDDFLPGAVIELLLCDGNRPSMKP
jgi:hypothetical protein